MTISNHPKDQLVNSFIIFIVRRSNLGHVIRKSVSDHMKIHKRSKIQESKGLIKAR